MAGSTWQQPLVAAAAGPSPTARRQQQEVRRGQYAAFLVAPDGYRDRRWWPVGSGPDESRAVALQIVLEGDPGAAATWIRLDEATAYAAWRGRRLPTLPEWEYAVRGGKRYAETAGSEHGLRGLCEAPLEWTATPRRLAAGGLDFPAQCRTNLAGLLAPLRGEARFQELLARIDRENAAARERLAVASRG